MKIISDQILLNANYFYNLGFNVSCINGLSSIEETINKNLLKCPYHKWHHLIEKRQTLAEMQSYNWESAVGLGVILGYNTIRCLDFDGVEDFDLIKVCLKLLNLPDDYEWVTLTGSCKGFHIFIKSDDHNINKSDERTKAFSSYGFYSKIFERLELRWKKHVVIPPSKHVSLRNYEFLSKELPKKEIMSVPIQNVYNLIGCLCSDNSSYRDYSQEEKFVKLASLDYSIDSENNLEYLKGSEDYIDRTVYEPPGSNLNQENIDELPLLTSSEDLINYIESENVYKEGKLFKMKESGYSSNNYVDEETQTFYVILDTETTGLNDGLFADPARAVQIAWATYNEYGNLIGEKNYLIKPEGFIIPNNAVNIHNISNSIASQFGSEIESVLGQLNSDLNNARYLIGHNIEYDLKVLEKEFRLKGIQSFLQGPIKVCTMKSAKDYCRLEGVKGYKYPKLSELYKKLFDNYYKENHNALDDVRLTFTCFWELKSLGIIDI